MDSINLNSPFFTFDANTWSTFKHSSDKLTLTEEDLKKCVAFNDRISLDEVSKIYLPLSRLINLYYNSRHNRVAILQKFLGKSMETVPFIISISGPVSVGKSTVARLLHELLSSWPSKPKVSLITTDGFLFPNKILNKKMIMSKKGFPVSYDVKKLMQFLIDVKDGKPNLKVPEYSHSTYDVLPDKFTIVDRPNILIIEGINVLQNGADYPEIRNRSFISDFIDFSIYVDAKEELLLKWYIDRFLKLREKTFNDPTNYFHKYCHIPEDQAIEMAKLIWESINHVNLIENIRPSMERANLVLQKGKNHKIEKVLLRK
ncbi:MAG: type I pantothenate kinase [Succinivibrio sp.]|nr:type I pantothenate kinase [Succinivibrio sp.]